jgi:hypothetical protein
MLKMSSPFLRHTIAALLGVGAIGAAAPAFAQRPSATPDPTLQRRFHLKVMEGVLVSAVRHGADLLGSELRPINPNLVLLAGTARARGFLLDGYGVFFDVEIPALRESVAWTIRTMLDPDPFVLQSLAQMKRQVATLPESPARGNLEKTITAIERQMSIAGGRATGSAAPPVEANSARRVAAAGAPEPAPVADTVGAQGEPDVIRDPDALYTEAVKNALIDAMLDHGGPMGIGPDEWLTVAAKDAEGPLSPNEPYEASTIVLRIKGSDLAAFRADRLTRDEARGRVEVREF